MSGLSGGILKGDCADGDEGEVEGGCSLSTMSFRSSGV